MFVLGQGAQGGKTRTTPRTQNGKDDDNVKPKANVGRGILVAGEEGTH